MRLLSVYVSSGMYEDKDRTSALITRLHSTQVILSHGPSNCVLITEICSCLSTLELFNNFHYLQSGMERLEQHHGRMGNTLSTLLRLYFARQRPWMLTFNRSSGL